MQVGKLSKAEFDSIFDHVPRLTVEVIVGTPDGIVLTERNIEPCKGMWHIPGGTVKFGEKLTEAVKRVALDELNVEVDVERFLGYIEYPLMVDTTGYHGWPVGMAFMTKVVSGKMHGGEQGSKIGQFKDVPERVVPDQGVFLKNHVLDQ